MLHVLSGVQSQTRVAVRLEVSRKFHAQRVSDPAAAAAPMTMSLKTRRRASERTASLLCRLAPLSNLIQHISLAAAAVHSHQLSNERLDSIRIKRDVRGLVGRTQALHLLTDSRPACIARRRPYKLSDAMLWRSMLWALRRYLQLLGSSSIFCRQCS